MALMDTPLVLTMNKPRYNSLQEYMERTGTSARRLLELVRAETGHIISPAMFSYILRGSRRCSRYNAFALHVVTGVPIDAMTEWPKVQESEQVSGKRQKSVA